MGHRIIDAENVAERYVSGRLSPEEAARFEEHYLDCAACCSRIEAVERLERGLRRLAEQAAGGIASDSRFAGWGRSPRLAWAAAAVLVAALLPAGLELRQVRDLRGELAATRGALARERAERAQRPGSDREDAGRRELQAARRELAAAAAQREALAQEIAADRRPQANLPSCR